MPITGIECMANETLTIGCLINYFGYLGIVVDYGPKDSHDMQTAKIYWVEHGYCSFWRRINTLMYTILSSPPKQGY